MSQDIGKLLEEERKTVLAGLKKLELERQREADRRLKRLDREDDLLTRGQQAGVPVQEMAEALGISRQSLHTRLRQAKEVAEWGLKKRHG